MRIITKDLALLMTLLVIMVACQKQYTNYCVEGNIGKPDYTGAVHIIDLLTTDTIAKAQVENGVMQPVKGRLTDMCICMIEADDNSFQRYTLYIDKGTTHMDGCDEDGKLRLSGTHICDELNRFNLAIKQNVEDLKSGKRSEEEADSIGNKLIFDFISHHTNDMLGVNILTDMAVVSLPPELWLELLGKMNPKFNDNPRLASFLSETKAKMEICAQTWIGKQFVDFSVEYNGKKTHLSDFVGRGNYVLADFWASWCGPCRQQIPDLIAIHQQYQEKGLTVLGIAVRDEPEKTKQAISELDIPYPQIINAQDTPSTFYGIDAIPHTILFAPDGTIIARNIYGTQLKAKLQDVFGK